MNFRKWCVFVLLLFLAIVTAAFSAEDGVERKGKFSFGWSVEAEYPRFGLDKVDRRICEWLEERVNGTVSDVAVVSVDPDFDGETWKMAVNYVVCRPSERAVSIIFDIFTDPSRAAHPMTNSRVLSFDLKTEKELALADLFAVPEKALEIMAQHAPAMANEEIKDRYQDDYPDGLSDDKWFMDGFAPKPENYAAIVMVPGGVQVIFQKYQVLPYVFGVIAIEFPLELLDPAGPNLQLWGRE